MKAFRTLLVMGVLLVAMPSGATPKKAVTPSEPEPIKILAIGNSFSMDSVDQNFYQIAKAGGQSVIVGDMYIGGCSIERHVGNIGSNSTDYRYLKIDKDGNKTYTPDFTLAEAIKDEEWDFVTVQQASHYSGQPETYAELATLVDWIRENAPTAEVVFHQTWAYGVGSNHWAFPNYGSDQWFMYDAITRTVVDETAKVGIKRIIPTGTALQNARRYLNDFDLTRDGFHMSLDAGRYIAACTWYETLFNRSVLDNSYVPDGSEDGTAAVGAEEAEVLRRAAHNAVLQYLPEDLAAARFAPTADQIAAREKFNKYRFGIFIHWGIYSMLGDGEWAMQNHDINYKEYPRLAGGFYPSKFDAAEWAGIFKEAGAKYVTITSRHHDGFSMFDSDVSDYNVVDATPFHRDVIGELAGALSDEGLALNFYYSHLDWGREDYWPLGHVGHGTGRPEGHLGDWEHYLDFVSAQLSELLTKYGPIGAIWFDGVWDKTDNNREAQPRIWHLYEQYELIHKLQNSCLVANNHHLTPFPAEDIQVFERDVPGHNEAGYSGDSNISSLSLETCQTMCNSWGYRYKETTTKSLDSMIKFLVLTAGKGANLLLNVGPRPDGTLPDDCVKRLREIGEWLGRYGETIYDTDGGLTGEHPWGCSTMKENKLFVHILENAGEIEIPVGSKANKLLSAATFDGEPVAFTQTKTGIKFAAPARGEEIDKIVVLTFKKNL
ncbi:MAG: alpha-L-fucosidase [Bacteroidales bacterium]|nr:alpha-L-fucosidase [Bacteroidales bacterium]